MQPKEPLSQPENTRPVTDIPAQPDPVDLTAEPLQHSPTMIDDTHTHPSVQPQILETPNKKLRIVLSIVACLLVAGTVVFVLLLNYGRISVSDLVEVKLQNTSYLRPRQWKELSSGMSGFGDRLGKNNKSTELVAMNVGTTPNTAILSATDGMFQHVRTQVLDALTAASITPTFEKSNIPCTGGIDLQKEADTSTVGDTIGIYKLTATCNRDKDTYIMKMRGVVGRDGYIRTIGLLAPQTKWNMNTEAYQKVIDSLRQISTTRQT